MSGRDGRGPVGGTFARVDGASESERKIRRRDTVLARVAMAKIDYGLFIFNVFACQDALLLV